MSGERRDVNTFCKILQSTGCVETTRLGFVRDAPIHSGHPTLSTDKDAQSTASSTGFATYAHRAVGSALPYVDTTEDDSTQDTATNGSAPGRRCGNTSPGPRRPKGHDRL